MEPQVELRAFPHIAVLVFSKKSLNAYFSLVVLFFYLMSVLTLCGFVFSCRRLPILQKPS